MTAVQHVARLFGWIFVLIAIWGAVLAGTSMEADPSLAPRLWGLFPVNFLHNLVHLLIGLWGIGASRSAESARGFAALAGAVYLVLAVVGLLAPAGFGLVPLGGHDVWLHALLGVVLVVAGVTLAPAATPEVEPAGTRTVQPPTAASPEPPEHGVDEPPQQPEPPDSTP